MPDNEGQRFANRCLLSLQDQKSPPREHFPEVSGLWNQAERHLRRFDGIQRAHFGLFLKECEWRFNNPNPKTKLKQLKQWVKQYMG